MARSTKNKKNRSRQSSSKGPRVNPSQRTGKNKLVMVFARQNYMLMMLGVVLVVVGFYIMRMENEVDGVISLYIAPLIILGGYMEIVYAILWRPKQQPEPDSAPETV